MPDPAVHQMIDEPQTLTGLFPPDSDDESNDGDGYSKTCFEIQSVVLAGVTLRVRQFDFHSHNANRVWPGTFNLADYLLQTTQSSLSEDTHSTGSDAESCTDTRTTTTYVHQWGRVLELGTATGILATRLALASTMHSLTTTHSSSSSLSSGVVSGSCCTSLVTSDVEDDGGDVQANVQFNYTLNHLVHPPPHVPHTWGTGWAHSVARAVAAKTARTTATPPPTTEATPKSVCRALCRDIELDGEFDTIVASDILLYVSAYPALVETLQELMMTPTPSPKQANERRGVDDDCHPTSTTKNVVFAMSWNRRMKESAEFFDRMKQAGFSCTHEGKCIYTFVVAVSSG